MAAIEHKYLDLEGCRVHYIQAGSGDRTVVLLHGMKFNAATWEQLGTINFLAGVGVRVIALDMPGFGESPVSELLPQEVLEKFFTALSLDNVVLVGPSMGGRTTIEFGINSSTSLAAMVVVGAVGVEENKAGLGTIEIPVLVVWGEEDGISPLLMSDILLSELPNAQRVVFSGAPHPCYLEQPENWHSALKKFILAL